MKVIAVNAGSSSLKFQLLNMPQEEVITSGLVERIGADNAVFTIKVNGDKVTVEQPILDHEVAVNLLLDALVKHNIIKSLEEIEGVGHRVVQGGELFTDATVITKEVVEQIEALNDLAPLHNPANITGIKAFQKVLPKLEQVAVFDTTFHTTMEPTTFMYATPYEWYEKYGVRKYGFHGTSHQYVSERVSDMLGRNDLKQIVLHMGNGVSITAIKNGLSVDTSMGLTPLEGVPMGTRTGNIDPAIIQLIANKEGKSLDEIINILNKKSGYLGVSGISNDNRDVVDAMNNGDKRAYLAYHIQIKRILDYIGSYYVQLGGLDAISFTAGIGENASSVREDIINGLEVLGLKLDLEKNKLRGENIVSTPDSKVAILVVPTDEEVMIARDVYNKTK